MSTVVVALIVRGKIDASFILVFTKEKMDEIRENHLVCFCGVSILLVDCSNSLR